MKSLKEICKENSRFTWDEIPEEWSESKERKRNPGAVKVPDFLQEMENLETGVFWECRIQDKGTEREYRYIEGYPAILVKMGDTVAQLSEKKHYNDNKKSFFLPWFMGMKYGKMDKTWWPNPDKPNYIGVWSEKKVKDWLRYVAEYRNAMEAAMEEIESKNLEIEKKIKNFLDTVPGAKVSCYESSIQVEHVRVTTNLFEMRFEHSKRNGYLSEKIEFNGTLLDVSRIESL